jgi:hypothetical protein
MTKTALGMSTKSKYFSLFTASELAQISKCLEDDAREPVNKGQYVVDLGDVVIKYISTRIIDAQTSAPPGEKVCILIDGFPYEPSQWSAFWRELEPKGFTPTSGDTMAINLPDRIKHSEHYFKTEGVRYVDVVKSAKGESVVGHRGVLLDLWPHFQGLGVEGSRWGWLKSALTDAIRKEYTSGERKKLGV